MESKNDTRADKFIYVVSLLGLVAVIIACFVVYDYKQNKRVQTTNNAVAKELLTTGNHVWFELKASKGKDNQKLDNYNETSLVSRVIMQNDDTARTYNYMDGKRYNGTTLTLKEARAMTKDELIAHNKANQEKAIVDLEKTIKQEEEDMDKVEAMINEQLKKADLSDTDHKNLIRNFDEIEANRSTLKKNKDTMSEEDGKPHKMTTKQVTIKKGDTEHTEVTVPNVYDKKYNLIFADIAKFGQQDYVRLVDVDEFYIVNVPDTIKNVLVTKHD